MRVNVGKSILGQDLQGSAAGTRLPCLRNSKEISVKGAGSRRGGRIKSTRERVIMKALVMRYMDLSSLSDRPVEVSEQGTDMV